MTLVPAPVYDALRSLPDADGFRHLAFDADVDPLSLVRAGGHLFGTACFVATPGGEQLAGLGVAWRASASGSRRFGELRDEVAALDVPEEQPVFLGYAFAEAGPLAEHWSGFGAADAVLPVVTVHATGNGSRVLITLPPGSDADGLANLLRSLRPPPVPLELDLGDHLIESHPHVSDWQRIVAEAVGAIKADELAKVVLARSVVVRSTVPARPFDLLHHLLRAYPGCYAFAWESGDAVFLGASPELLLEMKGSRFVSNPLAGSAARGEGEVEDRALGESLMASDKDRLEHALVVDDVVERLGRHAVEMTIPATPTLRRVATVQHLSTEITGTFREGTKLLDVVADLHPTPAVGGTPRHEAVGFIDKTEGIDRGWYTGGIGWLHRRGDGAVALALRCGLLRGSTAHLYAGAGIVADSDPAQELIETRLKLRPLLELLASG